MALFTLTGTYASYPASGAPSGDPVVSAPIDERLMLSLDLASEMLLTTDAPVALPFGGLPNAAVVIVKAVGGPVLLRLTSAEGTQQRVPVDSFAVLTASAVPYTAVDVTRTPGAQTTVRFFLGAR